MKFIPLLLLLYCAMPMVAVSQSNFVRVEEGHFYIGSQPYYFMGTNFWYGINLASKGQGGDRVRLLKELDHLQALGLTNLRIMASSEGPDTEPYRMRPALQPAPGVYNEELLDGLDFLLFEMSKRGMYAVMCFNNFWQWSGGMAQYVTWASGEPIPYPPFEPSAKWVRYIRHTAKFYKNEKARQLYEQHISFIINRVNTYTGKSYKEDPTIMSWQLANEAIGSFHKRAYQSWIEHTARYIKILDPYHLVSTGSEGASASFLAGNNFLKNNRSRDIDYTTAHIWVQNWGWYTPEQPEKTYKKAWKRAEKYLRKHIRETQKLNKPLVLEEFGLARDLGAYEATATTKWRDQYYQSIFQIVYEEARAGQLISGCNFWAWGGLGRPAHTKSIWKEGDPFIGDPAFEYQGWYSVYNEDVSTLQIIEQYAKKLRLLFK